MAVITSITDCSTNPSSNGPDGTVDPPSFLDDAIRYALSFIAQLRDGYGTPTGALLTFYGTTAPAGWIKLNGALVLRADYPKLLALANANGGLVSEADWTAGAWGRFSVGDGVTTIRLPDLRAMFVQGLDESRGLDVGRALGAYQAPDNQAHTHAVTDPTHNHGDPGHSHGGTTNGAGDHAHSYQGWVNTGSGAFSGATAVYAPSGQSTSVNGVHSHTFTTNASGANLQAAATGVSIQSQGSVARPRNLAYPMIMKF